MLRHHHLGGWKGMASKLQVHLSSLWGGHSEDKDDRFSLTLTSWQQRRGWRRREGMGGWKKESESNKTEMGGPRPIRALRPSLSLDGPSGGHKGKIEECICVFSTWLMKGSRVWKAVKDSLNVFLINTMESTILQISGYGSSKRLPSISYLLMLTCKINIKHLTKMSNVEQCSLQNYILLTYSMSNNLYWPINHTDLTKNFKLTLHFCSAENRTYFTIYYVIRCQYTSILVFYVNVQV